MTPEEKEDARMYLYKDFCNKKTDYELMVELHYVSAKLMDKDGDILEFDRRDELINIITEIDPTGEHSVSGFEDIRNNL